MVGNDKPASDRRRYAGIAALAGVIFFLLGGLLIARTAHSNDGSPIGWFFLALGVLGVLSVLAILAGAYDR
ncbi:MAG: hypothetical protein ACRDFX_13420 [Chloroflexota bacterium]